MKKDLMKIVYSLEVVVYDEKFSQEYLTIRYHDIEIDFKMKLEGMTLMTEWDTIKM